MSSKIIIGIISCKKYKKNQDIIKKTWLKNIKNYPNIEAYFVIGDGENNIIDNTIHLNCKDNYEDLPDKVISFFEFCYDNLTYDYIFKIDDDCYVNLDNFHNFDLTKIDYGGYVIDKNSFDPLWHVGKCTDEEINILQYNGESLNDRCSGPGYVLSNHAVETIVLNAGNYDIDNELYEDKLIADILSDYNIYPTNIDSLLKPIIPSENEYLFNYLIIHLDNSEKELLDRMLIYHDILTHKYIEGFSKYDNNNTLIIIIILLIPLAIYYWPKLFNNSNTVPKTSLN